MKILDYINNGFDYVYFRIAKAYFRFDGKSAITALLGISLFQNFLLFVPTLIIIRHVYGLSFLDEIEPTFLSISIAIQIGFLIRAYFRYRNIGRKLEEKWGNEKEPNKSRNGTLVVLVLIFPFVLVVIF